MTNNLENNTNVEGLVSEEQRLQEVREYLVDPVNEDKITDSIAQMYNQVEEGMSPKDFDQLVRDQLSLLREGSEALSANDFHGRYENIVEELTKVSAMNSYHNITPPPHVMSRAIIDTLHGLSSVESKK